MYIYMYEMHKYKDVLRVTLKSCAAAISDMLRKVFTSTIHYVSEMNPMLAVHASLRCI
jgi:hypothetical protein